MLTEMDVITAITPVVDPDVGPQHCGTGIDLRSGH